MQISRINVDMTSSVTVSLNFYRATKSDEVEGQKLDGWINVDTALVPFYSSQVSTRYLYKNAF